MSKGEMQLRKLSQPRLESQYLWLSNMTVRVSLENFMESFCLSQSVGYG